MAQKRRFLDVWITESNTVYREVPYAVVTDWVQQGRLLEDDKLRPSGTAPWFRLGGMSEFTPFLPKGEPFGVDDQAEALEPVHFDFTWKRRPDDEDDDVDMIPLIDISLVLLIFFMMTAAIGGAGSLIDTPQARYKLLAAGADMIWIGIAPGKNDQPQFSLGKGETSAGVTYPDRMGMLFALEKKLQEEKEPVRVNIRAHRQLPYDVVRDLTAVLEIYKSRGKIGDIVAEVSEKEGP